MVKYHDPLDAQEMKLLRAIAAGVPSDLVPIAVDLDENTVNPLLWGINVKLGTTSREAMVEEARRHGLVPKRRRSEATPLSFEGIGIRRRCVHGRIDACDECEAYLSVLLKGLPVAERVGR